MTAVLLVEGAGELAEPRHVGGERRAGVAEQAAVAPVRSPMLTSASPIAVRSAASPETNCCNWLMRLVEVAVPVVQGGQHAVEVGDHPADHRVPVGQGVGQRGGGCSRLATVPPSPCSTWMISYASLLTSCGRQRGEQRPEAVEQRGQVERRAWSGPAGSSPSGRQRPAARPAPRSARGTAGRPGCGTGSSPARCVASGTSVVDGEGHLGERCRRPAGSRSTWPTRTPAIRTSSPGSRPVTSVNRAR